MKKISINFFLLIFFFLFFSTLQSKAQNNLTAGDIAIVSYQSDFDQTNTFDPLVPEFEDRFSIVVLKSGGLAAGTVIYFTDRGWDGPNVTWLDNGTVGHEGVIKWVVPGGGVAQGTEVYFIATYHDETAPPNIFTWAAYTNEAGTITLGTVTTETSLPVTGMDFTFTGDNLLVYQTGPTGGPAGIYSATPIRFITALLANIVINSTTYAGWDAVPVALNESSLPPGLTNGTTAFVMSPGPLPNAVSDGTTEPDNGKYNCTNSNGVACSAVALSTFIYTTTNWNFNNTQYGIGLTTNHCTYSINTPVTYSLQPSASTSCVGLPVSFSVTASGSGTLTYQWQESNDVGFTSPTTLSNTGVYSNTGTNTLNISDNSVLNGKYYRAVVSNSCGAVNSSGVLLTATAPTMPSAHQLQVQTANTNNNTFYAAGCAIVEKIVPSGATPISGLVAAEMWREASVLTYGGQPYVQRHYQATPTAGSTGTVTLYFTQAEFDNFNAHPGSLLNLPVDAADALNNKQNLRISKFNGSTNNGTGLPGSYTGGGLVVNPPDANIVWNATYSRWEVTFDVSGFSGFFVQTSLFVLPVNLISFSAQKASNDIQLKWQTADETNNDHFELERSLNGRTFTTVGQRTGNNGTGIKNYDWLDAGAASLGTSKVFYRLKIVGVSGSAEYSNTVVVYLDKQAVVITGVNPNPFIDKLNVGLNMPRTGQVTMKLTDITGRLLHSENVQAPKGFSTYTMKGMEKLTAGMYILSAEFEGQVFTYKVKK
jgi:hypothetical protein